MSIADYNKWYLKQIEAMELFHKLKQELLGSSAPKRYTDKPVNNNIEENKESN